MDIDRIALNALIERLIESRGGDPEARIEFAAFARALPYAGRFEVHGKASNAGGGAVSGRTPQHGDVQVDDDRPEVREFSREKHKERVGYYKISRLKHRKGDWVLIEDFWKSDLETQSETELARQWALCLDPEGQPRWFGERGRESVWRLPLGRLGVLGLARDWFCVTWGEDSPPRHFGGYMVEIGIGG